MGVVLNSRPAAGPAPTTRDRLAGTDTPPDATAQPAAAELWGFLRVLVVTGALVGVTIFLVTHYATEKDAAAVLGIVAPVLATIVGVGLGFASGNTAGRAQGQADKAQAVREGRQALAQHLLQLTDPGSGPGQAGQEATIGHVRAALGAVRAE
jgi:hypothetical protein